MRRWLTLVLFLLVSSPAVAQGERTVAVRLLERASLQEVRVVAASDAFPAGNNRAKHLLQARDDALWLDGRRWSEPEFVIGRSPRGGFELELPGGRRRYGGRLTVRSTHGLLAFEDELPIETYVASVVSSELPVGWPMESLKAQAVLARTLAVRGGDHPNHVLCDLTHCQVFRGDASRAGREAAGATRGLILTYHGAPIQPLYHSTCGGVGAANDVVFGGAPVAYLSAVRDAFCQDSPHAKPWAVRISREEISRTLGERVTSLAVLDRSPGGWVSQVSVSGRTIRGYRFWQAMGRSVGWGALKSLNFTVRREGDAFVFEGKGLGHGVGLCQWGSRGRAREGWSFRRILTAYFPGTILSGGS